MSPLRRFAAFLYDFVIGDDWRLALGVVVALGGTALVAHAGHVAAWWLLPAVVVVMLAVSVRAGTRRD